MEVMSSNTVLTLSERARERGRLGEAAQCLYRGAVQLKRRVQKEKEGGRPLQRRHRGTSTRTGAIWCAIFCTISI